jgi:hypothetical protein
MVITVFLRPSRWMPCECLEICYRFKRHRLCESVAKINRGVLEVLPDVYFHFMGLKNKNGCLGKTANFPKFLQPSAECQEAKLLSGSG